MSTDDTLTQLSTGTELTRRDALKLFGAGIAMLQAGCLQRAGEEIRPSVRTPETSPGTPRLFATSMTIDGYATGLLAVSNAGRPTKIEGNPAHPASLGATLAVHQASVIELYDPHRLGAPKLRGAGTTWDQFRTELRTKLAGDIWLVLPPDGSPAVAAQLAAIRSRFPRTRVVHHSLLDRREAYRGAALAFGNPLEQQLALDRADVVVSLDADFLASMPMSVRWSHDFALRRRAVEPGQQPVRLFVVEPALTPTGSMADHRSAMRASDIAAAAVALVDQCNQLGIASIALPAQLRQTASARLGDRRWIELAARALQRQPRRSAIVVGDRQPAAVHALLYRLSLALGNVGATTSFTKPVVAAPLGEATLADLAGAIRANQVDAVLSIETDPVHDAPPELGLAGLLRQVPLSVHAAHYDGETSAACRWQLPLSHFLECWGDARAWDGTRSTIQPLIRPIHDTLSRLELLAMLAGEDFPDDRMLVRRQFGSDADWHAVLSEGVVANSAEPAVSVKPAGDDAIVRELTTLLAQPATPIEIDLAPSPSIGDGRFANNPWLQELPHPITKQTWGNAALMSAATAKELGVRSEQVISISRGPALVEIPALVSPGHADGCITIELGYGQRAAGAPISHGIGANAAVLGSMIARDAAVIARSRRSPLARTQLEFDRNHRETAFRTDLADYRKHPDQFAEHRGVQPSLLDSPRLPLELLQWAMTIDTTICTGCSSCVIACQAENNIPTVGASEVRRGREMHWLRIDTYYDESQPELEVVHQPMLCQHCEMAPCEYVCPVFATSHSPDGLNEMTYNRCIGTRFCSNNCPYKVRRFNWFAYDKPITTTALQKNPNVTVRERGVMEKCTYCVQRIRAAEIQSRVDKRPIAPGEVKTACQQACPTQAIQFGALQHTDTEMVKWRSLPRAYATLHELGTQPRTIYLAKITNPEEGT